MCVSYGGGEGFEGVVGRKEGKVRRERRSEGVVWGAGVASSRARHSMTHTQFARRGENIYKLSVNFEKQ